MSRVLPITLGVRRRSGNTEAKAKAQSLPPPESVWREDDFTCQFCGFRAEKFQRSVAGGWLGHARAALTACVFCEQCFALETVGIAGAGYLIWLPEVSQAELNHLCRAIYIAKAKEDGVLGGRAQTAIDALLARRGEAKKRLGSDEPLLLGTALLENMGQAEYDARGKKLEGIRLFSLNRRLATTPEGTIDQFPAILDYWTSPKGPCRNFPVNDWLKLFPV